MSLFQYSFCSYSTVYIIRNCVGRKFQYSFCSYSTKVLGGKCTLTTSFNTASVLIQPNRKNNARWFSKVSIQLLFLFNQRVQIYLILTKCFNTASVLIQQECLEELDKMREFQYSFCSYSTQNLTTND